jgi:hypothetical protein
MFTSMPFDAAFCESVSANATEVATAPLLCDAISSGLGTFLENAFLSYGGAFHEVNYDTKFDEESSTWYWQSLVGKVELMNTNLSGVAFSTHYLTEGLQCLAY